MNMRHAANDIACASSTCRVRPEITFGGLVGIGCRTDSDHVSWLHCGNSVRKNPCIPLFRVDLRLERVRDATFQKFMGEAGVAVFAAEFAAPVRIDRSSGTEPVLNRQRFSHFRVGRVRYSTRALFRNETVPSAASRAIPTSLSASAPREWNCLPGGIFAFYSPSVNSGLDVYEASSEMTPFGAGRSGPGRAGRARRSSQRCASSGS